jgi:hypothetical protein
MAEKQTCEVGSTLAPLAIGTYSDGWFWKIQNSGVKIFLCKIITWRLHEKKKF